MKKTLLSYCVILACCMNGFAQPDFLTEKNEKAIKDNKVSKMTIKSTQYLSDDKSEQKVVTEMHKYNKNGDESVCVIDEAGHFIRTVWIYDGENPSKKVEEYYWLNPETIEIPWAYESNQYTYDDNNKLTEDNYYNEAENSNVNYYADHYSYTDAGEISQITGYDHEGYDHKELYYYDDLNRLLQYEEYDSLKLSSYEQDQYSAEGNLIYRYELYNDYLYLIQTINKFEYNDKGQLIESDIFESENDTFWFQNISFDLTVSKLEELYNNAKFDLSKIETYFYNDNGLLSKCEYYDMDMKIKSFDEYEYDFFSKKFKEGDGVLMYEFFDDNKFKWFEGESESASAAVSGGTYAIQHKASGTSFKDVASLDIDTKSDFEIQARIKVISGDPAKANFGLIFGCKKWNGYFFGLGASSKCEIFEQTSKGKTSIYDQEEKIDVEKANSFYVKKIGDTISFYLNGKKVSETEFSSLPGSDIGFWIDNNLEIEVEDLVVLNY
jgi:hypothetical protein